MAHDQTTQASTEASTDNREVLRLDHQADTTRNEYSTRFIRPLSIPGSVFQSTKGGHVIDIDYNGPPPSSQADSIKTLDSEQELSEQSSANRSLSLTLRDSQATIAPSPYYSDNTAKCGDEKHPDVEKQETKASQSPSTDLTSDSNLVVWDGTHDSENPMNWPRSKKWVCTFALGFMTFCVTFASSVFSAATLAAARHFHTSIEVMVLGTALFVLGFAFGPILWGPLSELYGRRSPLFTGIFLFAIFQIPAALARNPATLFISRFLAGIFGSAPLTIVGGALADFWNPVDRGVAVAIFSSATFLGPTMGPIVGGFLTENHALGWRWTSWITLILTGVFGALGFVAYPESFAPVLLQRRARKRREETGNRALHAAHDEHKVELKQIGERYLAKPLIMLVKEPILLLVTIYMSFIYGILYLFFEAYPISFQAQRGWSIGLGSLPFIAVMCGVVCGALVIYYFTITRYARIVKENGRAAPEERLIPMMIGGGFLPIGLFWYAWTSSPKINPWPQIIAGAPIGMGILLIFLQGLNYIIDVYLMNANSAIAGNTFVRSWLGAGFPM
ncbi:MAG: hypothetical protein M1822_005731 [Bathelium mastoideum]|nr:MAG: hypothetical protein M1822_005731 [Bathelium mastoideum]